ncbi:MAG: hypothetical protein L0220_08775 [Acidobacteria bacterium]|nr:hypothetical protein [Acidobacteriota bacterium]
MKDQRFFNEAEKAKSAAAAKTSELAKLLSGKTEEVEELKTRAGEVKDQIADQVTEMNEVGINKIKESLADFNAALPLLREAGYFLEGMNIELGIPLKIVARFSVNGGLSDEKVEALLAENAEREFATYLVKSIQQATKPQSKIDIKGLKPSTIAVELGLLPQIAVNFKQAHIPGLEEVEPGSRLNLSG